MDTNLPVTLAADFHKITRVREQVCPRVFVPNLPHCGTPRTSGRWASRAARPALRVSAVACSTPSPPPPRPPQPSPVPPHSAPLAPPGPAAAPSRSSRRSPSSLHGDAVSQALSSGSSTGGQQGWPCGSPALRGIALKGLRTDWGSRSPRLPRHRPRSLGPEFCIPEIPRNHLDKKDAVTAPKDRQNGRFLAFDPKEKVTMEPNEAVSNLFGRKPRLANKLCFSPTQVFPSVAKTLSEKKEVSPKKSEDKVSLRNTENKISPKSIDNKDTLTNHQSDLWSSSFIRELTGEEGQDAALAKQEKTNEYCLQDIDDKLSESTDEDERDPNDEEDKGGNPKKETQAPLELMAEFLRAEMGRDYHLAKKLCQMILIYEPENPVAKEFFSLIEEILLKEKAEDVEEDDDNSEDSSSDSEGESSDDASDDSSDECEDAS